MTAALDAAESEPRASDEDLAAFAASVRSWVNEKYPKQRALEIEAREHEFPHELWQDMADAGFHAIGIDEAHGGSGGDVTVQVTLVRELARSLAGVAWVWGISSFAGGKSVGLYGSEEQKARFLPRLARGDLRFSIALTEPDGGTDLLGAMRTRARRQSGGWLLDGRKTWCTAALDADNLLVLARTETDVPRPSDGLTLLLVPRGAPGLELRPIPKLGMRAIASCEVVLDGVFVPDDMVLGEPGSAWKSLVRTLNNERILVAAVCLGILDGVLEEAVAHARTRESFGRPIGQYQAIQHAIADIAIWRREAELLTFDAARLQARGEAAAVASSMAKLVASERATQAADAGIQVLGGMGYSMETHMQRYWRDARIYRIAPITNEMVRNAVAESV